MRVCLFACPASTHRDLLARPPLPFPLPLPPPLFPPPLFPPPPAPQAYDGGWATHSIEMIDTFFRTKKPEELRPRTLVLPYPQLFPFSWKREELMQNRKSLFDGHGFNWDQVRVALCFRTSRTRTNGAAAAAAGTSASPSTCSTRSRRA